MEKNVHDAIQHIEILCQEKLLMYQKLMGVFRKERKAIIQADMGTLWVCAREKQDLASQIHKIRSQIVDEARESGLALFDDRATYSLNALVSMVPNREKAVLMNLSMALNDVKRKITALSRENRIFLEDSLKTIEDLVRIITTSCVREERYGRETYTRQGAYAQRMTVMRGEV